MWAESTSISTVRSWFYSFVLFTILVLSVSSVNGASPRIKPFEGEKVISSGSELSLTCEGTKPVEWKLPVLQTSDNYTHDIIERAKTVESTISKPTDGYGYRSKLILRNASFLDTGYFTCSYEGTKDPEDFQTSTQIYIYVEDPIHLLVHPEMSGMEIVHSRQSQRAVLPCRPTHPDIEMNLFFGDEEIYPSNNSKWSFNAHEGFVTDEFMSDDIGIWNCIASNSRGNTHHLSIYTVIAGETLYAPKPHINGTNATRAALNGTFSLNCSISYETGLLVDLKWEIPDETGFKNNRIKIEKLASTKTMIGNMERNVAYQILTVTRAQSSDDGNYTCISLAAEKTDTTHHYVRIHDDNITYVNVKTYPPEETELAVGEEVRWIVEFEAFPEPVIKWFTPNKVLITSKQTKYEIKREPNKATLLIKDLMISDQGNYYFVIEAGNKTETRNMTLLVNEIDSDFTITGPVEDPFEGEVFSLSCKISLKNFTTPVTWFWTLSNRTTIQLENKNNYNISVQNKSNTFSYVKDLHWKQITFQANGNYTCQVHTKTKQTQNKTVTINVRKPTKPTINDSKTRDISVKLGEKMFLNCTGQGFPLPKVTWYKNEGSSFKRISEGTVLYYEFTKKENAGIYTCILENRAGSVEKQFIVEVEENDVNKGIIAAIVVVILIAICLVAILARKVYQDKKRKQFFQAHQLDMFDKGDPQSINPDLPVDEQTELLPYDKKWEFPRDRLKLGKQLGAGAFGRVVKGEAIGIDANESVTVVAVKMVKSNVNMIGLKALMSELKIMIHLGQHLNVVNLLGACTKNVTKGELLVIVEYCRYGNIQNYLIRHRDCFINQINEQGQIDPSIGMDRIVSSCPRQSYETPRSPLDVTQSSERYFSPAPPTETTDLTVVSLSPTGKTADSDFPEIDSTGAPLSPISTSGQTQAPWRSNYRGDYRDRPTQPVFTRDLLCWAFQTARGMDYLASRKVLHGDLAARNILLADENVVKIADFGLAREVYRSGNYKKKGDGPLPVKWMAIESIIDRVFSTQSDVWSFGIVLWELFSLGKTPYPGIEADERFFRNLQEGFRMEKPKFATKEVYQVMLDCWNVNPQMRPTFMELEDRLGNQIEASIRKHYVDLNNPYLQANQEKSKETTDYLSMMGTTNYVNVRESQMPHYVNLPNDADGNSRDSNYLTMGQGRNSDAAFPQDGSGYLFMTSPAPSAAAREPASGNRTSANNKFNFDFVPKFRKLDEEVVDSAEMYPMLTTNEVKQLNVVEKEGENETQLAESSVQSPSRAFSNPNYLDNLPFAQQSNLKDIPEESKNNLSTSSDRYINVPNTSSQEDHHYINQPKNCTSIAV